jgi:hypothetical protein
MDITDSRSVTDFQKNTFCGHPRAHVVKVLIQNVQLGHPDYSCYWALELLASGLVHTLWMAFFQAAALHVNRAQPNVFLYLADAYERYAPLEHGYSVYNMTDIRNHPDVRRIICEVASTLAMCRKNKISVLPTIKPSHDFDPVTVQEHLNAPSSIFGKLVLRPNDPLAVSVPVNEICFALRQDVRDATRCLYWMSWILAFCREHKKQTKEYLLFANRGDDFVNSKEGTHVVWMLWDCIQKQVHSYNRGYIDTIYKMYCVRWSSSDAKSRQPLLIAAVLILCEGTTMDTSSVNGNTIAVSNVLNGIPGWIDAIVRTKNSLS